MYLPAVVRVVVPPRADNFPRVHFYACGPASSRLLRKRALLEPDPVSLPLSVVEKSPARGAPAVAARYKQGTDMRWGAATPAAFALIEALDLADVPGDGESRG
jgi:hypothetical protein